MLPFFHLYVNHEHNGSVVVKVVANVAMAVSIPTLPVTYTFMSVHPGHFNGKDYSDWPLLYHYLVLPLDSIMVGFIVFVITTLWIRTMIPKQWR